MPALISTPPAFAIADGLLLLVAIFWGSSYVAAKSVLLVVPIFLFLFIRFAMTVAMMLPVALLHRKQWNADTGKVGVLMGLLLFLIFSCETIGIAGTTPANAGLLICLCVVLTPLIEGLVFRKRPSAAILFAVVLSFAGAALLNGKSGYRFNQGDLFILGAAVLRAVMMTSTKKLTDGKTMDSGLLTIVQLGTVALLTGTVAVVLYPASMLQLPTTAHFWGVTLYLCVFCTIFAFYVQTVMVRQTTPTRVGLLMGAEPIFATLFAVVLWQEKIDLQGVLGASLIVMATYLGLRASSKPG